MITARTRDSKAKLLRFFGESGMAVAVGRSSKAARVLSLAYPVSAEQHQNELATTRQNSFSDASNHSREIFRVRNLENNADTVTFDSDSGETVRQEGLSETESISSWPETSLASTVFVHPPALLRQQHSDFNTSDFSSATAHALLSAFDYDEHANQGINNSFFERSASSEDSVMNHVMDFENSSAISLARNYLIRPLPSLSSVPSSSGKLTKLLGPDARLDISLKEIENTPVLHEALLLLLERPNMIPNKELKGKVLKEIKMAVFMNGSMHDVKKVDVRKEAEYFVSMRK
ncbi:hypothetical protein HK100_010914 [Physocladia obscura]|uniref:Uncharacterized protein n=1 Tax=Physocladia obscura TaxID=109957 RepID=A0AAD5T1Z5_9FUNG|nr:hypothetical protein HK100_010914 [Physocladia obscura]